MINIFHDKFNNKKIQNNTSCLEITFALIKVYPKTPCNYEVNQELGGRELSPSACPGWGIDHQERKKLQMGGGVCSMARWAW